MKTRDLVEHIFPFIIILSIIFFITYNIRAYIDKVEKECATSIDPVKTNDLVLQTGYIIASVVFFAIAKISIIIIGLNLKSKNFERASLTLSFFNTLFIFSYLYMVYQFQKEIEEKCGNNQTILAMGETILTYIKGTISCISCIFILLVAATFVTTSDENIRPSSPDDY
jgi:preprotein translocase subunit YajC